ncbi:MAG TPA: hypothetical protein VND94_19020 [Terriglobia bacterium]|nr:hypothetical protein [Terriglobia bacterium]
MIIAFASLAGVIVIGLGIAGILKIKWAVQIIVGLIALTGLAWLVASAQGQGG